MAGNQIGTRRQGRAKINETQKELSVESHRRRRCLRGWLNSHRGHPRLRRAGKIYHRTLPQRTSRDDATTRGQRTFLADDVAERKDRLDEQFVSAGCRISPPSGMGEEEDIVLPMAEDHDQTFLESAEQRMTRQSPASGSGCSGC